MLVYWTGWRAICAGRANGRIGLNRLNMRKVLHLHHWRNRCGKSTINTPGARNEAPGVYLL